jgi:hypothetical protein
MRAGLASPALYDLYEDHHDGDDQENMNESTHGVGRDEAKQPKDNQDNRNSSKHVQSSLVNAGPNRNPVISTIVNPGRNRDDDSINASGKAGRLIIDP